jgi:hypothetical protein
MANTDIVATYFPLYTELTPEQLQETRTRLADYLRLSQPQLDMRPDSVFGNLYLSPAADFTTALEVAMGRFMSDCDLENTANGITYSCPFVTALLANLGVTQTASLQSSGAVRFLFTADGPYFIDRRTQIAFSDNIFTLKLAQEGGLTVNPVGTPLTAFNNNVTLTQVTSSLYAFDWPVAGTMTTAVTAGDTASANVEITNLSSITALADFAQGSPEQSLAELAKKARQTFYSASLNNRGSARRLLTTEFADVAAASPVLTGDFEMVRSSTNALGIATGALDAIVKSTGFNTIDTITVQIPYYPTQQGEDLAMFIGPVQFNNYPLKIDSITYAGDSSIDLNPTGTAVKIFSESLNSTRAPMASCAYSNLESYWVAIPMPLDPATGDPLITPAVATDGSQYAEFTITYRIDPLLPGIAAYVGSPDVAAVGVDTLVKSFVPIVISSMDIRYVKAPGTTVLAENARTEVYNYIKGLGGHVNLYSNSRIYDIMYYAGAQDVRAIVANAKVQFSVAGYYLPYGATTPDEDYVASLAEAVPAKVITISSSAGFLPTYKDPNFGEANASYEVVGDRNVAYILDADDITFTEIL